MKLNIYAASNVGSVRLNNEDMILVGSDYVRDDDIKSEVDLSSVDRYLVALADGMGGHNGGDIASSDVLHNLCFFFGDLPVGLNVSDFNESIFGWMESINCIIDSKGRSNPLYREMGTTLVAFAYYAGEFYWMNCGDSRVYRFRDGVLTQLSTDHSLNNLMGESGHSGIITNCIGGGCKTSYIDIVKCTQDVTPGDVYLLCSDGLTDLVSDNIVEQMLNKGADANSLCEAAIAAGGYDNVSACVIKIE